MEMGIQAGFGERLGAETLAEIKARGFALDRLQAYTGDPPTMTTPAVTAALVQEVIDAGLRPYTIVYRATQIADIPPGLDVEMGNEPDLGAHFGWPKASEYYAEVRRAIVAAQDRNPLWVGVVSNLNKRGFAFLEGMDWPTIPAWVGCAIHRYPDSEGPNPSRASKERRFRGPNHRDEEIAELKRIVGPRALGISEIGYARKEWSEAQQSEHLAYERALFARHGFEFCIAYQINSTPTDEITGEDTYGFRRLDGTWRPMTEAWTA